MFKGREKETIYYLSLPSVIYLLAKRKTWFISLSYRNYAFVTLK